MLEIMRKLVIGLITWNLCLTVGFCMFISNQIQDKFNNEICNQELIPLEIIEEDI